MYPYAVIKFLKNDENDDDDDDIYSEIPSVWICMNQQQCWWPKSKNVRSLMLKGVLPNNSWQKHQIEIRTYCLTLEKARKKAERCITASLEENERKHKKLKRSRSESDDSSSDSEDYCTTKRMRPAKIKCEPIDMEAASTSSAANKILESIMENNLVGNDQIIETGLQRSKFEDTLLDLLTSIKNSIKNTELRLSALEGTSRNNNYSIMPPVQLPDLQSIEEIRTIVPLKTIDEIDEFENLLKIPDSPLNIMLLNYLKTIGGDHVKNFLVRMLQRLFTNDLAQKCSWLGQRHNYRICDLMLIKAVRETLMQFHVLREKEFESMCSEWFRQGKMRFTREIQRMDKLNQTS